MFHRIRTRRGIGWMLMIPFCALIIAGLQAAEDAAAAAGGHRVVLLAPSGPVLLDVRLETGAQSIGQVRAEFCDSLFKRLDADQSGLLEPVEQALVPAFRRAGGGSGQPVQSFLTDGNLTSAGLRRYIDDQLGPEFAVEIKPPRLDQSVRLLDVLDVNGDGVLSVEEVVQSSRLLSRYDLDDDESLSVGELQPFPQSVRQAMRAEAEQSGRGVRIFLADSDAAIASAVEEIRKGSGDEDGVELQHCGLSRAEAVRFDQDGDGRLSAPELAAWIGGARADLQIRAQWRSGGLPPAVMVETQRTPRVKIQKTASRSRWSAGIDDVPLEVSVADNRNSAIDAARFMVIEARRRDTAQKGYLTEEEFAGISAGTPFAAVDLNQDGMLYPDEIRAYFAEMSRLSQTRVVMTFSDDVTSLFQLMDADRSNRLTIREMATLEERLAPLDRNRNGVFDPGDFVSEFRLSLAFSAPQGLDEGRPALSMSGTTAGVRGTARTGPLWFQRMDRNRDHDISWREFLGPRTKFDAIDTNGDGLISREEAEAADAMAANLVPP